MEHLDGETLAERLKRGPLSLEQALEYGVQTADALDKAHREGDSHRRRPLPSCRILENVEMVDKVSG